MRKNSIRKQWDDATEPWVDFVRSHKDFFRDEMNNPTMFDLLGDIRKKRILDVGCGEGYNARIMAKKGAKVTAVDFSRKMISRAIQEEKKERLGIRYHILDSAHLLSLKNGTFDVATCFMALQDIEHLQDTIRETCRVLKKRGRFVFSIPHPCFEVRSRHGKIIGGWKYGRANRSKSRRKALYYAVDEYFDTGRDIVPWTMKRLTKQFKTTAFHRTLTEYADTLHDAGFLISKIKEAKPTKQGARRYAKLKLCLRIPHSIVIEAVKAR